MIAVPQSAVSSTLYGDSIYVVKPGEATDELKAEQVFVTVGRRSGGRIEVVNGLAADQASRHLGPEPADAGRQGQDRQLGRPRRPRRRMPRPRLPRGPTPPMPCRSRPR